MASPYSDHSSGVPSPPTVVSEYNRPIDVVNTDGPHLVVTEQPQSKFRFRYKSEMVGTHGQLKAERADRNKPIFPTVKLVNWKDGPALIRLALYTGEDNFNQRTRHVHELGGKNCDKDTGMCEMVVDQTTDYTASFQNLGIIHIAKRDVRDIIKHRKKKELIDHVHLRQPHRPIEEIRQSITPTDMKKFDEEAEEISKMMDLNKVVLRFQAFHYDTSVDCYRALTRPVDSELVVNLKNASTGELKIVRMSECSAPCTGGTDVWMLVEKVKKSNIKIKFYELDSEFKEVWSAYGEFSEADVHHQYAIIFRTPPYRTTNLRQSVRVKVQLERPNDKDISEPRDFTYYPSNRKRQSPFMESTKVEEDEDYSNEVGGGGNGGGRNKRHCHESTEPLDLRYLPTVNGDNYPIDGIMDVFNSYYNDTNLAEENNSIDFKNNINLLSAQQSPPYMVPSPNHPGASPNSNSNHSFYQSSGINNTNTMVSEQSTVGQVPQIQVMVGNNTPFLLPTTTTSSSFGGIMDNRPQQVTVGSNSLESPVSPKYHLSSSPNYQASSPNQMSSPQYQAHSPQQPNGNNTYQQSNSPVYQNTPSPMSSYQQSPSPIYQNTPSPSYQNYGNLNDHQMVPKSPDTGDNLINGQNTIMQQHHQQMGNGNQMQTNGSIMQQMHMPQQMRQTIQHQQMGNMLQMGTLNTPTINVQSNDSNEEWNFQNLLQTSEGSLGGIDLADAISLEHINPDLFGISDLQTDCVKDEVSQKPQDKKPENFKNRKPCQINDVDELSHALGSVKISGNKQTQMPSMKQKAIPGSVDIAFLVAISAAESLQAYAATGDMGLLLATHRYLLAVQNNQGDNALHTAVSNKNWEAFNKILTAAQKLRHELLNTQNFAGETPLHLAVRAGELAMTDRLVSIAGTDISLTDRNGNTALHIAASLSVKRPQSPHAEIMAKLLTRPVNGKRSTLESTLEIYNYQGETALHVAVISNNLVAVRQMVSVGAIVHLCERKRGANCLHLAAQYHCLDIAHFLIQHTNITVNSRMFDGNTALHIAVQEGHTAMCAILMEAGADPHARNSLKIRKSSLTKENESDHEEDDEDENESDEDDETENEEPNCYTPIDYAGNNMELLRVLEGQSGSRTPVNSSKDSDTGDSVMDSGIGVSANDLSSTSVV